MCYTKLAVFFQFSVQFFLPRDAMQSAVMQQYVVCPSFCL